MYSAFLKIIGQSFFQRLVLLVLGFSVFSFLFSNYSKAWAETERVTIEIPVYTESVLASDLTLEAEALVENAVKRHLQNPVITAVQVTVVADRNGEYVPILVTRVSRAQWQATPSVSAWTSYFNAAYALLQRHDSQDVVLARAAVVNGAGSYSGSLQTQAQIDGALDEGRLTGPAAQQVLSDLD